MTKYFMGNGTDNVDFGLVVKSNGNETESTIDVRDELGNGAGWTWTVNKSSIIEINKNDYDFIINCHLDWTTENEIKLSYKVKEILKNGLQTT